MTSKGTLIGILITLTIVVARRPFTIKVTELLCIRYAEPLSQFECHLDTIANQTVINVFAILSEELDNFKIKVNVDLLRSTGATVKMLDTTVDGCRLLDALDSNNIMKIVLAHIRKSGHIPQRCPISANENFTLTRYAPDADLLPLYTPEFSYSTDIRILIGSTVVAKILANGSVESKKKTVFLMS